ncbi:MAG: hypothetical protein RLN87_10210 [Parasphingopyxis sp.]|uniref:DUF6692 family protein n=1 Tax=Parasphingopyxis sp. TaxID=1920299 RepID=UPI0032EE05EC
MTRATPLVIAVAVALSACNSNTAPGNDQEAEREAPAPPAPQMSAAEALSGIATGAIQPETMTDADVASLGGFDGRCALRLTEVGLPSLLYDGDMPGAAIKLNGKLITLPAVDDDGLYREDGLTVRVRLVDEEVGRGGRREAEMIVMLPGADDELGFRGYEVCY